MIFIQLIIVQPYMKGTHRGGLKKGLVQELWNIRQEMKSWHSILALGKRASSFPSITSAATVLNRFLQGNLAELNSDGNAFISPSNIDDRHRDWHRKTNFRGKRWLAKGKGRTACTINMRNCEIIRRVFVLPFHRVTSEMCTSWQTLQVSGEVRMQYVRLFVQYMYGRGSMCYSSYFLPITLSIYHLSITIQIY